MTEKKVPPPRPPAPKLSSLKNSRSTKTNLPSVSIKYNPLMANDDDDDDYDYFQNEIAIVTEKKKPVPSSVPAPQNDKGAALNNQKYESKPSASPKQKQPEKKENSKPASLTGKSKSFDRGLITVSSETLAEEEETKSLFDGIKDAISDPLTFYSKMFEEEEKEMEERPPPSPPFSSRPRSSSARTSTSHGMHSRTKSLDRELLPFGEDALDLVPDHYQSESITFLNKPASGSQEKVQSSRGEPAKTRGVGKAPDSPKRQASTIKKVSSSPMTMSFSNLLVHSVSAEDVGALDVKRLPKQASEVDDNSSDSPHSEFGSDFLDEKVDELESPKEDKPVPVVAVPSEPFPFTPVLGVSMLVYAFFTLPLPAYLEGMFVGFAAAFYLGSLAIWLMAPANPKDFTDPIDVSLLPPLRVPVTKTKMKEDEKLQHKGWLNELMSYDPDNYHISHTHSVFLRLENYSLRLSRPKQNIPRKASWDEPKHTPMFIHQRHFDLRGSEVYLLPEGLCRKRWWSKKYPICIQLAKAGTKSQRKVAADSPTDSLIGEGAKGFDIIQREECTDTTLILFGRTGREKEEWYRKLEIAANWEVTKGKKPLQTLLKGKPSTKIKDDGVDTASSDDGTTVAFEDIERTNLKAGIDFYKYMSKLIPKGKEEFGQGVNIKSGGVTYASPARRTKPEPIGNESPASWVNAGISRSFWDFLREQQWAGVVANKIQRKLSKIKVPYFINQLEITDIDLGIAMPVIRRASPPVMDERGLWVDLDITYYGSCCMTLETKLNLTKLGKDSGHSRERTLSTSKHAKTGRKGRKEAKTHTNKTAASKSGDYPNPASKSVYSKTKSPSAALDSDEEDSAESSEEEDVDNPPGDAGATENSSDGFVGGSTSKKILRIVDKVAKSKYFQKAAENSYVKKAIEEVSNLPLVLTVEVKSLHGTLAINLPPPPSDRLWYGFRTKPNLWLSARPKLGMRQVRITHVTDWIEKKLEQEFQKVFVMPNMDDLVIPIMDGGMDESYTEGDTEDM